MKIILLQRQNPAEERALSLILQGIQIENPDFIWTVISSPQDYLKFTPCFRIYIKPIKSEQDKGKEEDHLESVANIVWPSPVKILKDVILKERIWTQIQETLLPAFFSKSAIEKISLNLEPDQIKRILLNISNSETPFTFSSQTGMKIGVNLSKDEEDSVDVSLSAADISSMLAASWVFGATCIELPKGNRATRNRSNQ